MLPDIITSLNTAEWAAFAVALCLLTVYLYHVHRDWKATAALAAVGAIVLVVSLSQVSQFLTIDETYTIDDSIYTIPLQSELVDIHGVQWFKAKFRSSTAVFASLAMLRHRFFNSIEILELKIIFKCLHWMLGFLSLLGVHYLTTRNFVRDRESQVFFSALYLPTAMLLPSNDLALKIYNGDLLSMALGLSALLLIYAAFEERSRWLALGAVAVGLLAAQDKLVASPVLLLAMASAAYLWHKQSTIHSRIGGLGAALGVALVISLAEVLVLGIIRDFAEFDLFLLSIPDPLISWSWVFFQAGGQLQQGNFQLPIALTLLLTVITLGGVYVLSLVLKWLDTSVQPNLTERIGKWSVYGSVFAAASGLVAGLIGVYVIQGQLVSAEITSLMAGYVPATSFNGLYWYVGASNPVVHTLAYIAFVYADVFASSFPTVMWLGVVVIGVMVLRGAQAPLPPIVDVLLLASLLAPLALAVMGAPVTRRYANLFLFIIALVVLVRLVMVLRDQPDVVKVVSSVLFGALFIVEVLPFAPLFGASFRPVWIQLGDVESVTAQPLDVDPLWAGFGEETALLGKQVEALCEADACTLYSITIGDWLTADTALNLETWKSADRDEITYTDADYFIVNRHAVRAGWFLPEDVEPELVLAKRGYVQAWVYRGDKLADAGFEFPYRTSEVIAGLEDWLESE